MAAVQRFKGVSFRLEAAALGSSTAGSQVAAISQKGQPLGFPRFSGSVVLCLNSAIILRASTSVFRSSRANNLNNIVEFATCDARFVYTWLDKEHYKTDATSAQCKLTICAAQATTPRTRLFMPGQHKAP
ncbi:hypothetical protein EV424DRAFT_1340815 [Suillus variegatus]|nr:hypothetical protein EV424DRAFT_1340815 [Suillus variegatus]